MKFDEVGQKDRKVITSLAAFLDMDAVKQDFAPYHKEIDIMVRESEIIEVSDEASLKDAITLGGNAKTLGKKIDAQRKEIVAEPNQFVKAVNAFAKTFTEKLTKIENSCKKKIGDYQYKQELARREQEKRAQETARKLQAEMDKEAEEKGVEKVQVSVPVIPKQETVARSDETGASAHVRTAWVGEIEDEKAVPREYCSPDQKKINAAVKMGVREIPGVKIWEKPTSVLRT